MSGNGTIVYVTGRTWSKHGPYRRAVALARSTGASFQVVSDRESVRPRLDFIRRSLPADTVLVVSQSGLHLPGSGDAPGAADQDWLRSLPCSVWVLPPNAAPRSRIILAAVELSTESPDPLDEAVVETASLVASVERAQLLLVHAWSLIGERIVSCPVRGLGRPRARRVLMQVRQEQRQRLDALLSGTRSLADADRLVDKGTASQVIRGALYRTGADMLVIGYRGRTGLWELVQGNLAEDFLEEPRLSVVAVRSQPAMSDLHDGER